jgi:hypothetical protein
MEIGLENWKFQDMVYTSIGDNEYMVEMKARGAPQKDLQQWQLDKLLHFPTVPKLKIFMTVSFLTKPCQKIIHVHILERTIQICHVFATVT